MIKSYRKTSILLICGIIISLCSACANKQDNLQIQDSSSLNPSSIEQSSEHSITLADFNGTWEREDFFTIMQERNKKFTYQLDFFEEGKITLS